MNNKEINTDFLSKEEINDIFEDIFEFPEEESVLIAYHCAQTCGHIPSGK